jgi:hypothetical protein
MGSSERKIELVIAGRTEGFDAISRNLKGVQKELADLDKQQAQAASVGMEDSSIAARRAGVQERFRRESEGILRRQEIETRKAAMAARQAVSGGDMGGATGMADEGGGVTFRGLFARGGAMRQGMRLVGQQAAFSMAPELGLAASMVSGAGLGAAALPIGAAFAAIGVLVAGFKGCADAVNDAKTAMKEFAAMGEKTVEMQASVYADTRVPTGVEGNQAKLRQIDKQIAETQNMETDKTSVWNEVWTGKYGVGNVFGLRGALGGANQESTGAMMTKAAEEQKAADLAQQQKFRQEYLEFINRKKETLAELKVSNEKASVDEARIAAMSVGPAKSAAALEAKQKQELIEAQAKNKMTPGAVNEKVILEKQSFERQGLARQEQDVLRQFGGSMALRRLDALLGGIATGGMTEEDILAKRQAAENAILHERQNQEMGNYIFSLATLADDNEKETRIEELLITQMEESLASGQRMRNASDVLAEKRVKAAEEEGLDLMLAETRRRHAEEDLDVEILVASDRKREAEVLRIRNEIGRRAIAAGDDPEAQRKLAELERLMLFPGGGPVNKFAPATSGGQLGWSLAYQNDMTMGRDPQQAEQVEQGKEVVNNTAETVRLLGQLVADGKIPAAVFSFN